MEVRCPNFLCIFKADPGAVKAQGVADSINKSGGKAIAVAGDMLDSEYIKVLVKKAAEFGNGKIHIIVNNAGLASCPFGQIVLLTPRQLYMGWRNP